MPKRTPQEQRKMDEEDRDWAVQNVKEKGRICELPESHRKQAPPFLQCTVGGNEPFSTWAETQLWWDRFRPLQAAGNRNRRLQPEERDENGKDIARGWERFGKWADKADERTIGSGFSKFGPYSHDHKRIRLGSLGDPDKHCDYINASPIRLGGDYYIATQCPMKHTVSHFWQMVWEQDARVIVMLMAKSEVNHGNAVSYIPEEEGQTLEVKFVQGKASGEADTVGPSSEAPSKGGQPAHHLHMPHLPDLIHHEDRHSNLTATVKIESCIQDKTTLSQVSKLSLKRGEHRKTIWHYWFQAWPDRGTPSKECKMAVIELARQTRERASER
ncbi:MAG: hypothetical protein Q9159_006948 [Coniocarpon cinnabarinum]